LSKEFKYKAFISYSRAADSMLAPEIKSALQKFAKPWYKLRAIHVFCDQTNLTANPDLWASIEKHLGDSEYFIYLASPQAAQSKWVKKEIQYFHSRGRADKIIIVLTDGKLAWNDDAADFDWPGTDALPDFKEALFKHEPTWLDMVWIRKEQLSFRDPRFLDAAANLSSTLRNIDKDILIGKDVEEHKKAKRFRMLSVSGLIFLAIFLLAAAFLAVRSEKKSQERLVRTFIGNGIASLENEDYIMAFPWFVQAAVNEKNGDRKALNRFRVENLYSQMPELVQVWKTGLPVLKTEFVSNSEILVVSGNPVNWWTNEFDCQDSGKGNCRAELKLVNTETGKDVYNPVVIDDGIRTMALSTDKTLFASLSVKNMLRVWNLKDGKLIWEKAVDLPISKQAFQCEITFNRQNTKMLFVYQTGDNSSRMDLYDLSLKNILLSHDEANYNTADCYFLGNGDSVIFLSSVIKIWDIKKNKVIPQNTPYFETITDYQVSPDEKYLAIAGDKSIQNFRGMGSSTRSLVAYVSLDAIQKTIFTKEFDFSVTKLEFDAEGKMLGANSSTTTEAASFDEGTRVWDVLNGNPLTSWLKFAQEVDFSFDREGKKIIVTCNNGTTEIWEVGEGGSFSGSSRRLCFLHDGSIGVKSVFSPDGNYILTAGEIIKLWKVPQLAAIQTSIDKQEFADDSMNTTNRWEVLYGDYQDDTTYHPSEAYIYEKKINKRVGTLKHNQQVYLAQISWDGNCIATVSGNDTYIWDRASQRLLFKIPAPQSVAVKTIAFSLDNSKIVTSFTDLSFRVWDAATGTPVSPYIKHPPAFIYPDQIWVRFSKDGKKLISTDGFSGAMLWDITTGDPLCAPVIFDRTVPEDSLQKRKQAYKKNNSSPLASTLSADDLKLYAELIANLQMDAGGSFVPISNGEYLTKWEKWKSSSRK
jgi:WD40 repeat protein